MEQPPKDGNDDATASKSVRIARFEHKRLRTLIRPRIIRERQFYSEEFLMKHYSLFKLYSSFEEFVRQYPSPEEQEKFVDRCYAEEEDFKARSEIIANALRACTGVIGEGGRDR